MSEPVEVVDWSPEWQAQFDRYARRLREALGVLPVSIEHVGSTSVQGLAAKPIIDIDVVLRRAADVAEAVERLGRIGYRHEGDLGIPGRAAFAWPPGEQRHHLYVVVAGSDACTAHLIFRDYLRDHPDVAQQYASLKRCLAGAHAADRAAYTEGKTEFIDRVLETAAAAANASRIIE
jgi:GrpB-like predicted nucleotidyltransferase (UPF0157 family)